MLKEDKERVIAELTEKLRRSDALIVADYRGLTMPQIDSLRGRLIEQGATFTVVKNTLTRRAAEAAGADALLALLEGPSAIAFVESEGNAVAVAKALSDSARETKILAIRGGVMRGREMSAENIESLAKLPSIEVLRGQVLGVIIAPLTQILGLVNAPLQNLLGLIDARVAQLENQPGADSLAGAPVDPPAADTPAADAVQAPAEGPVSPGSTEEEPQAAEDPQDATDASASDAEPEASGDTPAAAPTETTTSGSAPADLPTGG